MTKQYWCELGWLGGDRAEPGVQITVDGDRIAAVCTGVRIRPEGAVLLRGLTLPALANAHSHAFHRALRGRTHSGRGNFWTWRDRMYDSHRGDRPGRGLGPGTTLVHATHACERDQAMIGGAGSHCCLCPTTERDLADGTGPSTGLAQAGAGLCLGSDSHATVDILEEARTVELDQRAATHDRGVFSVEALTSMATSGGHRSLGWPEGGAVEAGALADFATVGLDSVRMAGASADTALAATIFAATGADVHHLVVGGRTVVRGGRHTTIDVAPELASAVAEVTAP